MLVVFGRRGYDPSCTVAHVPGCNCRTVFRIHATDIYGSCIDTVTIVAC